MREALFIKKNKDKWTKIQQSPATDADELANDFTELVNDHTSKTLPDGLIPLFDFDRCSDKFLTPERLKIL